MSDVINTHFAPTPIGAYSQAIKAGNTIYVSGQIPINPATGELISGEIKDKVIQVFENIKAIALASGSDLKHIVKLNVYLFDLANITIVNEVMEKFFQKPYPARTTIEVKGLPKNVPVEIDAVIVI